jgi:LysR family transcriptional regulator, hydrogen peroxide-inducible genes activator
VQAGMGVTVVPQLSVPKEALALTKPAPNATKKVANKASTVHPSSSAPHVCYIPFEGEPPMRRVVLAWRRSFTRYEAIAALRNAVYACELSGVKRLS